MMMGRGGRRDKAGRKSGWNHSETQTIRVPKIFAAQALEYVRQLDSDAGIPGDEIGIPQPFESETFSESPNLPEVAPGQISIFDVIDSVSDSKTTPLRGDQLAVRLQVAKGRPSSQLGRYRQSPEKFLEWAKKHDPDGIAWRFDPMTKLYYPVEDSADDF